MSTLVTNPQRFYLEQRNFYDTRDLLFVNSLGGVETIRLRGQVDASTEYTRINADKISTPEYFANGIVNAETEAIFSSELEVFTGDTGFMPKDNLDRLRDLFNNKQVFEIKNGRRIPVNIGTKSAQWYSNRQGLYSISLQWQHAFTNEYYSPAGLIGTISTCPAVEKLQAVQSGRDRLTITWALETGYDLLQVEIIAAGVSTFYTLKGTVSQEEITFTNPAVDFNGANITIKGKTICNNLVNPPDLGPATTLTVHVVPNKPPTALYDYYNLKPGFTTPQALGNVLDNDSDANGDTIEVVPASGPTTDGGAYTIDIDGNVTYTPPSGSYTGVDSFTYTLTEVGPGALTATGGVYIAVNNFGVPSANVYVKIAIRNQRATSTGTFQITITAEIWLTFFSDAAATSPQDVTGTGINVNVNKTVTTNGNPVNTIAAYTATGYEMKIFTGPTRILGGSGGQTVYTDFTVAPGTGYQAI